MTTTARGTFEVTLTPEEAEGAIGRFRIEKTWSGDLQATSHGLMLSAGDPTAGSAGYVALESVTGSLHGRTGSFAFQQLGVMHAGSQDLRYLVVPGSGTGDLVAIEGSLVLTIDERGDSYELTYDIDQSAQSPSAPSASSASSSST